MRIERLRLENFRRFARADLEFPDGVTALVGRNGAGKSTLLESIGWCIYGHDAARTGKDLIKRQGAAPGDDVRVYLAFRFGGHNYEITRELLGKSGSHVAQLVVDGASVVPAGAQSHREVTQYITRLFHMDREAFFTSLVARQRELAALTDVAPAARKRILIGMLRLDAVDGAIVEARVQKRDAKQEWTGLRSAMRDTAPILKEMEAVKRALDADKTAISEADARIVAHIDEVEDVRTRRDQSRKRAEGWRALQAEGAVAEERLGHQIRQRDRYMADVATARQAAERAAALLPRLEALPQLRARLETLTALRERHSELARCRIELKALRDDLASARESLAAADAALAGRTGIASVLERGAKEKARLDEVLYQLQTRSGELAARAQAAARTLADLEAKAKKVRTLGPESPCPTCTRPLREHHDALLHDFDGDMAKHRAELAELAPQRAAALAQEKETREKLAGIAERVAELQQKATKLAREEERAVSAKRRIEEITERESRLVDKEKVLAAEPFDAKEHDAIRVQVVELDRVRDAHAALAAQAAREPEAAALLAEVQRAHTDTTAKLTRLRASRDALEFDPAHHEALEKAADAREERLSVARVAREKLVAEHVRRQDREKVLNAELAAQLDLKQRADVLEARVRLFEQLAGDRDQGLLPEFKDHLIGRIRPLLSMHAGRLFRDLTEGRYADLEIADDYGIRIHDEGEAFALERFSGGESDLANLCLRLAVSQVVADRAGADGFGFLALDEVFGSQDETRKQNILRALNGLSGRFRQILLITHISDVKESADHVLRVESLDDGTSRVVAE